LTSPCGQWFNSTPNVGHSYSNSYLRSGHYLYQVVGIDPVDDRDEEEGGDGGYETSVEEGVGNPKKSSPYAKVDREKEKIRVSKKETEIDTFETFAATHNVDEIIEGKVKQIKEFGAFVEIAPQVSGLLHV